MAQLQEPYFSRVQAVIDAIEAEKLGEQQLRFDMGTWLFEPDEDDLAKGGCGTAACIGGCAAFLARDPENDPEGTERRSYSDNAVCNWLTGEDELGPNENSLFYPCVWVNGLPVLNCSTATKDQALKVLRHLQATGEVDWRIALEEDTESA